MTVSIRTDDPEAAHVADLLLFHQRELQSAMGAYSNALGAAALSGPAITFWTAWHGASLAGFAALKELEHGHGEVKSMRAAPQARGTGVGRALLEHVIAEARSRGYVRLSLETGTTDMHEPAVALYRRAGFAECDAFADYRPSPQNRFFRLELT